MAPDLSTTSNEVALLSARQHKGVLVLADPGGDKTQADIVFVHGLTGDREDTWTYAGPPKCFWPQDLLPVDLSTARIMTWGYDAGVPGASAANTLSANRIKNHAFDLCSDLAQYRLDHKDRPIVFVGHSMGGLVIIETILQSREGQDSSAAEREYISRSTIGVLFMGTPIRGSKQADYSAILYRIVQLLPGVSGSQSLLHELKSVVPERDHSRDTFCAYLRERKEKGKELGVSFFCEDKGTSIMGMIVPRHSATLDGYQARTIGADHSSMVKFSGKEDPGYQAVVHEIQQHIERAKQDTRAPERVSGSTTVTHHGNNHDNAKAFYGGTFSGQNTFN